MSVTEYIISQAIVDINNVRADTVNKISALSTRKSRDMKAWSITNLKKKSASKDIDNPRKYYNEVSNRLSINSRLSDRSIWGDVARINYETYKEAIHKALKYIIIMAF